MNVPPHLVPDELRCAEVTPVICTQKHEGGGEEKKEEKPSRPTFAPLVDRDRCLNWKLEKRGLSGEEARAELKITPQSNCTAPLRVIGPLALSINPPLHARLQISPNRQDLSPGIQ